MKARCAMCGRVGTLVLRWYRRDDGQQEANQVCIPCADLHKRLIRQGRGA
jgi:hypothetical protein